MTDIPEPSSVATALEDPDWIAAMQEEMQQFYNQQVWKLVPLPDGKIAIRTKWILKKKRDARGIVVRNKAILVAQCHRQEEGIDYDEVYVDDIIFGSTNQAWCDEFEVLMKGEFEMSAIGELTFFLELQVKQLPDGIFISQDNYIKDMLKKFDMESVRTVTTPYEVLNPKSKDEHDDAVNVHLYRSMIGSLMYLTASRPDIMFIYNDLLRSWLFDLDFSKRVWCFMFGGCLERACEGRGRVKSESAAHKDIYATYLVIKCLVKKCEAQESMLRTCLRSWIWKV
nr:copia protein [Tanacetum cinerariifolium]